MKLCPGGQEDQNVAFNSLILSVQVILKRFYMESCLVENDTEEALTTFLNSNTEE